MVLPVRLPNWIHSFITIANHFLGVSGKGEPQNYPGSWSLSGKAIVLAAPINASKFNSFYKHYTYYSYYSSTHLANIFYNHDCNHPIISNHFQFHSVFRSPFLSFHNCPPPKPPGQRRGVPGARVAAAVGTAGDSADLAAHRTPRADGKSFASARWVGKRHGVKPGKWDV